MPELLHDEQGRRIYRPDGAVLRAFLADRSHVSIIRGPIGSGTSTVSCMKIWKLAMEQAASRDGMRHSRWMIVRNTYPELLRTTVETWLTWFPENLYGRLNRARPMRHQIVLGDLDLDVWFLALDGAEDIQKLRSAEYTGVWFNEIEYHEKEIFDEAESRTGRYPPEMMGGPSWHGVLGDMNAPTEDHWLPKMMGEVPLPDELPEDERQYWRWPKGWAHFEQPPALVEVFGDDGKTIVDYRVNPAAENVRWLHKGFYEEKKQGKSKAWIDSRLMNRVTVYTDGKAVWPNFRPEAHVAPRDLGAISGYPLILGQDFGRRPATAICQAINNRIRVLAEFRGYDMGASTFAPLLRRHLSQRYPGFKFRIFGDPKGQDRTQSDERTAYDIFRANGLPIEAAPCPTNSIALRLQAVEQPLNEMVDGLPRFQISPHACPTLKVAMAGKYCYGRKAGGGYHEDPKKDKYSDISDALQYACLGMGEGRKLVGLEAADRPRAMRVSKMGSLTGRKVA